VIARIAAFVRLGRPLFLGGGALLHGLGAAMAVRAGARLDVAVLAWGQAAITATQLMTHYANDYFDLEADRANRTPTRWSGGSRVLVGGALPPSVARAAAIALAAASIAAALALRLRLHAPASGVALLLLAVPLAWAYSAPPLRLCARGLGELTTAAVTTVITPLAGFALQAGRLAASPLLALAPLALLQIAMLLAIEFPDAAGDAASGKRTLVVLLGAPAAARLHVAVLAAAYAFVPLLAAARLPAAPAVAATSPLGAYQAWRTLRGDFRDPARWERLTTVAVALLSLTAAAELLAHVAW
jgi:1,4-dihydroxy-2-naphthoate octaprenyltransferase